MPRNLLLLPPLPASGSVTRQGHDGASDQCLNSTANCVAGLLHTCGLYVVLLRLQVLQYRCGVVEGSGAQLLGSFAWGTFQQVCALHRNASPVCA